MKPLIRQVRWQTKERVHTNTPYPFWDQIWRRVFVQTWGHVQSRVCNRVIRKLGKP